MHKVRCRYCDEPITFGNDPKTGKTVPLDVVDERAHRCMIEKKDDSKKIDSVYNRLQHNHTIHSSSSYNHKEI